MKKIESITIEDNEEYLRQISKEVDIKNDKELMNDISVLDEYCKENAVMAMAAVQLGIPKRMIYLKNTNLDIINKMQANTVSEEEKNYNEAKVLINPVITNREGLTDYWEACASCLDNFGRVLRPYKIELEYYDVEGNKKQETFEGFESTVLSHEIDHLDGILHIDIAEEVYQMPAEERKVWRINHGYKVYSKTGDYEVLRKENSKKKVLIKKEFPENGINYEDGYFYFTLESDDTSNLAYGTYQYDIEFKSEKYVKTLGFGSITLTDEITFKEDE